MKRKGSQRSPHPVASESPQNPFMNNEFLQFYANLHVSSVMFSDPIFQYRVMFPFYQPPPQTSGERKTKLRHHERRLAEVAHEEEDAIPSSAAKLNSLARKLKKQKEAEGQLGHQIPPEDTSPEKRRVSFSKNSPRWNLITPPPPRRKYFDPRKSLPKMNWSQGGEISLWSSEMEESDTTETTSSSSSEETNNSSTLEEDTTKENVPLVNPGKTDDSTENNFGGESSSEDLEQVISDSLEKFNNIRVE